MPSDVDSLLKTMSKLRTAAPTVDEIASASDLGREALHDALAEAEADGLVTTWEDSPEGVAVMLTPLAAQRLGLRLEEVGESADPIYRWAPVGSRPKKVRRKANPREILASEAAAPDQSVSGFLEMFADPDALEADEILSRGDHFHSLLPRIAETALAKYKASTYQPLILIGLRPQWNATTEMTEDGHCIGCLDRKLEHMEYCVRCLRSGIDHLLPNLPKNLARLLDRPATESAQKHPGVTRGRRGRPPGARAKAGKVKVGA